jgi:hypothetical protein
VPEKPSAQEQPKLLTASKQLAPFWQGLDSHSLMSVWQKVPEKAEEHEQLKLFTASKQLAPFWQGLDSHSLMSV